MPNQLVCVCVYVCVCVCLSHLEEWVWYREKGENCRWLPHSGLDCHKWVGSQVTLRAGWLKLIFQHILWFQVCAPQSSSPHWDQSNLFKRTILIMSFWGLNLCFFFFFFFLSRFLGSVYWMNIVIMTWGVYMCVLSQVWLIVTSWTAAHQAPLFTEFSRQEYWTGLPFPLSGNLPYPGIGTEQNFMVLSSMSSAWLLCVENLSQRISLIRETRRCTNKGKQSKKTK